MINEKTRVRHLNDRLKPEQPNFSNSDLLHEIRKNVKDTSTGPSVNFGKHCRKAKEEEELVKYMSNLPRFLEREAHQEKILNVGVLDWDRLEKYRSSRHSVSGASSSSTLSTEGPSNIGSNRGPSCSRTHQSTNRFMSSQRDAHQQDFRKFQDVKGARASTSKEQVKVIKTNKPFSKNCSEIVNQYERRDIGLRNNVESGTSHGKNSDVVMSTPTSTYPNAKETSTGLDPKSSKAGTEKPRSSSPFRRLAIGVGNIGRTFSSKESSAVQKLSTNPNSAKFPSENAKGTSRARSSPLRRLLDPLLKPKEVNRDMVSKSLTWELDTSTGARQPGVVKFDMASCTTVDFQNPSREKKPELSSFHALLRVAVKNGQPLFTFAVDNESNVLAATSKKLSSSRDDVCNCIYNFFAIPEVKKKNGRRINLGSKDKRDSYVPNVVAQLKVSGSRVSQVSREELSAREFVLFGVDLGQADQQALPNDELAAIVVKISKVIASNINATVILPSGVHTLPNKGGPSSLIQRWRSGGSCDCGGWDLGCKLRVFSNQNQLLRRSSSSVGCSVTDKFELIAQGGEEENRVVFSLSPFKDGMYSVEFTSSFSILQAFSLCIAVLDSRKVREILESGNLSDEKTSLEVIFARNDATMGDPNVEIPARFASYPPHSPVGRV